jgi:GNAT superfamily N-acetyltransferase
MTTVREITALDAHPLRISVLRKGIENPDVQYPQDDDPRAFHLGVEVDADLVAVASFSPASTPHRAGQPAWQLRGMAVADDHQGRGAGSLIIDEAIRRVRADGASVLWCNARDTALGFYEKLGFSVIGDGFVTPDSGLPHHVMVYDLS